MFESFATDSGGSLASFAMRREKKINWVEVGIDNAGGVKSVAAAMGVEPATVYTWIGRRSVSHLPVEKAVQFARLTRIDLGKLTGVEGLSLRERGGGAHKMRPMGKRRASNVSEGRSAGEEEKPVKPN